MILQLGTALLYTGGIFHPHVITARSAHNMHTPGGNYVRVKIPPYALVVHCPPVADASSVSDCFRQGNLPYY